MSLFLIRHGQTEANTLGALDTGEPGMSLTDLGRQQASVLPAIFEGIEVDMIVTSNLARTHETAANLAQSKGLDPVVDERIREIRAGDLEMRTDQDAIHTFHVIVDDWSQGDVHKRMPGAENGAEVLARFDAAVKAAREAVGPQGTVVMVAHGAVIRLWSRVSGGIKDPEDFPYILNTEVVELVEDEDGWTIVRRINGEG